MGGSVGLRWCWGSGCSDGAEGSSVGLGWQFRGLEEDGGGGWRSVGLKDLGSVVVVGVQEATGMPVGLV